MRATVQLPETIYRRTEERAQASGLSVDELIVHLLERELNDHVTEKLAPHYVDFPLIRSTEPGTLDLSDFNFDDLLA